MILEKELLNKDEFPESVEFDLLKTPSKLELIITFLIFIGAFILFFYAWIQIYEFFNIPFNEITAKIVGFLFVPLMLFIEKQHDRRVRSRVVGKIFFGISNIKIESKESLFLSYKNLKMIWINPAFNTVNNSNREYFIDCFETINIRVIDENGKRNDYHINNHSNNPNGIIASNYIKNVKNKYHFFKIHFHEQKRFSKKEYEKTLKRYSIMQNSIRNRRK